MKPRAKTAAAISRDDLLVLKTEFSNHTANEDKWQKETTAKLDRILEKLQPMVERHDTILLGVSGNGGLLSDMKTAHDRLDINDKRWYKLFGASTAVAVLFDRLISAIWK